MWRKRRLSLITTQSVRASSLALSLWKVALNFHIKYHASRVVRSFAIAHITHSGGIRKCAGCCKPLLTGIPGYDAEQDKRFCFGRFESYTYFNKTDKCHKVATSTRHYHLNPVCTKVNESTVKIQWGSLVPDVTLRTFIAGRFQYLCHEN